MRILPDTSAYSAFKLGHSDIRLAIQRADEICISPIVAGELLAGFRRGVKRAQNEGEWMAFLDSPRVAELQMDLETAHCYAEIYQFLAERGRPIPTNDLWIAASAMQFGLRVLTTDRHFEQVPQILVEFHSR